MTFKTEEEKIITRKESNRKYYLKNREVRLEKQKKYYDEHREMIKQKYKNKNLKFSS